MSPTRHTLDRVDLPLPGGRLLRLELHHDADGEPETLTLATGWCDPARPDPEQALTIPAETLPDLRAALAALDTPNTETEP